MAKIEKGIPIPENAAQGRTPKYDWLAMEIGDSIFTATKNAPGISKEIRDQGYKFTRMPESQQNDDGTVTEGWRTWRTE